MRKGFEKRLSLLEERLAERTKTEKICNCRFDTTFHNADCLAAILKGTSRVCPVHGFRELGFMLFASSWCVLKAEDNQFCPCPPDPWRSWVLKKGPDPRDAPQAAQEAAALEVKSDPPFNFKEEKRRLESVLDEYWAVRQSWIESGWEPPSREELMKLQKIQMKRAGQHVGHAQSASL
jgi:hypothetical protein